MTYMALCPTVQYVDVACIFLMGATFEYYRVERNEHQIQALKQFAAEWWKKYIVNGEKPEPQTERECAMIWARSKEKPLAATGSIMDKVYRIAEIRALQKKLDTIEDFLKRDIALFLQDCDTLTDEHGSKLLTYKTSRERVSIDWMKIALESGFTAEQVERCTTTKPGTRRLLIDKYIQRSAMETPISKLLGITQEEIPETATISETQNEGEPS